MDIEKLKKFEKLPPDVKRQLALYMAKWKDKKKEADIQKRLYEDSSNMFGLILLKVNIIKQVAKKFNDIAEGKSKTCNY